MIENKNNKTIKNQAKTRFQKPKSLLEDFLSKQKSLTTKIVTGRKTEALIDSFAQQLYEKIQQGD